MTTDSLIDDITRHLACCTINHKDEILKKESLKYAHLYCILKNVSAQEYGPLLENYIIVKKSFTKNTASLCIGDCTKDEKSVEIKASLGGKKHDRFNWVQLRPSHEIDYYLFTAYHLCNENIEQHGELYIFRLSKENMVDLIVSFGGYAHGTKKEYGKITKESLKDVNNKKEYALRTKFGDHCWSEMMKHRITEDEL